MEYGYNSTFPRNLRRLMRKHQITQKMLADFCLCHRGTIIKWSRGQQPPKITELAIIAEVFRVPIKYLLEEHPDLDIWDNDMIND